PSDSCSSELGGLTSRLDSLDASLESSATSIDAARVVIDGLAAQMDAIAARYPSGSLPPDAYATYLDLRDRYELLFRAITQAEAEYNASVQLRSEVAAQIK